ncbi:InlB B-repeat-containing protein [Hominifimenecus sp. rT4P-3]|uniref:InlB B-repeat-containing protein n=1 Tax=Hominifimenecus sp. rT4P-3 TaxID=3242979 RepID=UPI003DA1D47F
MRKRKWTKKAMSILLCLAMILGLGVNYAPSVRAASIDVGANPTPKIDIAVSVPSDYPGTFLEFKQELADKLVEQGLSPSDFRITTTAVAIDTTDTSGWYVYDHYRDQGTYNALGLAADQKLKQPFRQADNSHTNGTGTIESYFKNNTNTTGNQCKNFDKHIYSYVDDEGKASMVFAGYGTNALSDYMIYPAASNARRNFSFDINPAVIDTHTLGSYGFFLNAGINGGNVQGYALVFAAGSNACTLQKINVGVNNASMSGSAVTSLPSMNFGPKNTVRLTVELNKDSVTVQYQAYDASGNLGAVTDLLRDQHLDDTGFNGFGPLVNYVQHGCGSLSIMKFVDLEMSYEASAFDALKNVQYYEGADYKYFINLTGDKNDPQIPEEEKYGKPNENYTDGINRMNEKEIFYISNTDDGRIVTDTTKDSDGKITHQGLGSTNGFYAPGDNYTEMMAQFIAQNFKEGKKFQKAEVDSDLPLANFYIKDASTADEQMMTIHLQHLVNAAKYNETHTDKQQDTVSVNIFDQSRIGSLSGADGRLAKWTLTVTDPDNTVVTGFNKVAVDDPSKLPDFVFTKDSKQGRYTFTLEVEDQAGNKSKDFSTYVTAFLDNMHPYIEGENTGRNIATITLTDTGSGIDEDGITFIEDDRGSGVAAYWVTNDKDAEPTEDDWEKLPFAQHTTSFDYEITDTLPLVVWVRDECGNVGNKAVFQPTHVQVQDPDGNPIDDYYVIGEKPIIVLPPDDEVPDPEDPENQQFSGWETPGGDPVTPGTTPDPKDNEIIIRPSYSTDYANMIYLANGGTFSTPGLADPAQAPYRVVSGSSILKKVDDHNVLPSREGYSFNGWKLLKSDNAENAANETYINNAANVEVVSEQLAKLVKTEDGVVTRENYYLVAQWKIGAYTLRLDPNGGSAGNIKTIEDIPYQANIGTLKSPAVPVSGRGIPTKPGYIFQGWSESKDNDRTKLFKVAQGVTGVTPVAAPLMPSSDKTIYAVWIEDTNKFVVDFDSNGGSRITDHSYLRASATNYTTFFKPSRTGYTFEGWFEKIVDEDGNVTMGTTPYVGGETFIKKDPHTFIAKWTPNHDTKYSVDYYINSGNVDANGDYIYTRVNDNTLNKTYTGTTEAKATVSDADKLAEITVGSATYWFDAENSGNVLEGTITGSPALVLKLYYDRYFDVSAAKKGDGTVTGATGIKEGQNTSVSWAAAEGSYVTKVVIDGTIRDDLIKANGYTFEIDGGFHENHSVYVEFTKEAEQPKPNPKPTPGGDPVEKYYEVRTSVVGCTDNTKYSITPTTSVKAGEDFSVQWELKDAKYKVVKVEVDGVVYNTSDSTVQFTGIQADHSVVVTVEALPTIGGSTTEGKYTVTVNRYGYSGDDVEISKSLVVDAGEKATVSWDTTKSEYKIYKVMLDGEELNLTDKQLEKMNYSKKPLTNVQTNHVVDIYLAKPDDTTGEIAPPDFNDEKYIQLTTKLVGGPGEITGGAVISQGEDYKVDWDVVVPDSDPDSPNYTYYEVEKVVVDGETVTPTEDGKLDLTDIQKDTEVEVHLRPVLHRVTILKYGEGTVSPSKTVFHMANYKNIKAEPASGWSTVKIIVDGNEVYNYVPPETIAELPAPTPTEPQQNEPQDLNQGAQPEETPGQSEETQPTEAESVENETLAADVPAESSQETSGEISPSSEEVSTLPREEETALENHSLQAETVGSAAVLSALSLDEGEPAPLADPEPVPSIQDLKEIVEEHVIKVYFTQNNEDGEKTPAPADEVLHQVNVTIQGGPGNIEVGPALVDDGGETEVKWTITDSNYEVESVTVNGVQRDDVDTFTLENITEDQNVVIVLKQKPLKDNDVVTPPTFREVVHQVTAIIKGDGGSITGGGQVSDGADREVAWSIDEGTEVKYVFVNGVLRNDLIEDGKVVLSQISEDQTVVVTIGKPDVPPVNVDKDGDGEPDINIDTDDDGKPDVDIDTDGDGEPDINVDTDDDGEPDINIDTDDDGKPDVNVDTDDDGKPDINIDTDDDGKPDINIDTDDDGKPDVNIDTDDDGKPDINIDTDDDGKPDINIDTDDDGKPDVNIDTDDDGKPDVNIDTDDDGKPDVNIDTNGDGKPDINIDTNGDGKPDINIDTDKDGKPDINIDTNGDGKPDINIDIDGDGKPDLNIDTDGDGKPDVNIDADGDGKIDKIGGTGAGPKTGDDTNLVPFIAVLVVAAAALAVVILKKRKAAEK